MTEDPSFKPPVTVKAGEIQFIEACHPPLTAGDYTVAVRQQIKKTEDAAIPWNSDPYASALTFTVEAPRFALNPADVHSVYPPVNETGRYDNALPHVVFTRRTLPWERTVDGSAPQLGQPFAPWMALLLFEENELRIADDKGQKTNQMHAVASMPVFHKEKDSLLRPAAGRQKVRVPDWGQNGADPDSDPAATRRAQKWQKQMPRYAETACLAIDLPFDLFKSVAPHYDDLSYLAHVRQIDTGNKEVMGNNDRGWFSLVVGNRLPRPQKRHQALLVSLEGVTECLKEEAPAPAPLIRLAVLAGWHFTCEGSNDFKTLMRGLNGAAPAAPRTDTMPCLTDAWLHLPCNPSRTPDGEAVVQQAYARGYTAFNHSMRQGEQTVSWYRGPLVPVNYDKPAQEQEPVRCSDELLRYDPETGLFDTTYAAAWQLGRLLALQNQSFALALSRARDTLRRRAERTMHRAELERLRREHDLPQKAFVEDSLLAEIAGRMGKKMAKAVE